jgi:hypothetical protein
MYLHIGLDKIITYDEIIGIFDLDTTTVEKNTRESLANAEKAGIVEKVCNDLPKSFVVCEKNGKRKIYITQLSAQTLAKRIETPLSQKQL